MSINCLHIFVDQINITSIGRHNLMFFFYFSVVKTEHDDSVEYVSSYMLSSANDSVIYQGTVKKETSTSTSDSYMADDSAVDSSAEMGNVDYSMQLYELYNSRRNSIAIAPVLQADGQQIAQDAEHRENAPTDSENGAVVEQFSNVKIEPMENGDAVVKVEPLVKQETD